jgi:hypothetical protein
MKSGHHTDDHRSAIDGYRVCSGREDGGVSCELQAGLLSYLTKIGFKVVMQKSVSTKIRQIILYISDSKGQIDEFVGGVTVATRTCKVFL